MPSLSVNAIYHGRSVKFQSVNDRSPSCVTAHPSSPVEHVVEVAT